MSERQALFISHAAPEDNPFTIWLGAKLAAAGYEVWADVLRLKGGDDWQRKLEDGLRNRACKVLLVANQKAVDKQGVRNEIQIASEVARKIGDTRFIIPLKLGNFDAPFLIAHAQYIDFSRGWSAGLYELMAVLQDEYRVPRSSEPTAEVWTSLQAIHGRKLEQRTENLVSNWLRVRKIPGALFYYRNTELRHHGISLTLPKVPHGDGFLTCEEHSKLYRMGNYPTIRGTALPLNDRSAYLWTSGFVPRLDTYMGPETPNPILVRVQRGACDLRVVLSDVLGLTKINFNSCLFNDRLPVTIKFANEVGDVLISAPVDGEPRLPFKFYI